MKEQLVIGESCKVTLQPGGLAAGVQARGKLTIIIRGPDGRLKHLANHPNLVVTVGRAHIADQLAERDEPQMSHMAIGNGPTVADASDTALESEVARVTSTPGQGSGGNANQVVYVGDFPPGTGTGAITEAGIFNQGAAGTLLCRSTFPEKNKEAADSMTITWTLTFSA